jgi:hypothetical protein
MKQHYIYITTNLTNGKKYVGQHVTDLHTQEEMLIDGYYGSGTLLLKAIKKYGKTNFSKQIVGVYKTQSEVDQAEIDFINSNEVLSNKDIWYNRSAGGQFNRSENHREIMSAIMKEVVNSDSYKQNKILKGQWLSDEEKERKRLRGQRIHLINTLYRVIKVKKKEDRANGVLTAAQHKHLKRLHKWQRSQEGRDKMSALLKDKYKSGEIRKELFTDKHKRNIAKGHMTTTNNKLRELFLDHGIVAMSLPACIYRYSKGVYKTKTVVLNVLNQLQSIANENGFDFDIDEYYTEYTKHFGELE